MFRSSTGSRTNCHPQLPSSMQSGSQSKEPLGAVATITHANVLRRNDRAIHRRSG